MDNKSTYSTKKNEKNSHKAVLIENEESIENYEKGSEKQYTFNKNRRINSSGVGKYNSSSKPGTIMSLEDRDIVVIDNADIRDATKNENNVIVVENKSKDVDLAELLGINWPNSAGETASILNKQNQIQNISGGGTFNSDTSCSSTNQIKTNRNKTTSLLSHIGGTRRHGEHREQNNISDVKAQISLQDFGDKSFGKDSFKMKNICNKSESQVVIIDDKRKLAQNFSLQEAPDDGVSVGSLVEINLPEAPEELYGVIRWVGIPPGADKVMVGVELEDDPSHKQVLATDGSFNDVPLFKCNEGRAIFVMPHSCSIDRRFIETESDRLNANLFNEVKMFGHMDCPPVVGTVPPLKVLNAEELERVCGKFKGIQGHHNSCYLDATLFSMFTFTSVFDSLLFRPSDSVDIPNYAEVQKVLREEIVNPLRKNIFVRADRVMKLRKLLDKLSSVSGLMSEEKDPEEFLNSLLAQIMRVEPFLKLNSGQDAFFYQLFVEKDERLSFPTVQQLFEQSFHSSNIKLKDVPSCLIVQMPRFGKNYKMYPRILPSQVLDVTDIIEDSPRQCSVCGKFAEFECRDCFGVLQGGVGLESTVFCGKCLETVHMHTKRANHTSKKLSVPQDFRIMAEHMTVPRLFMELFAVVCIETSHYVAFVKSGSDPDAPWCFFDSMADRKGEQNGYNIPEMVAVPDLPQWLSEDGSRIINEASSNDKMLPDHAKRLLCDAYMCMYQSTDVMMYR